VKILAEECDKEMKMVTAASGLVAIANNQENRNNSANPCESGLDTRIRGYDLFGSDMVKTSHSREGGNPASE
jgi:hypothetical protein